MLALVIHFLVLSWLQQTSSLQKLDGCWIRVTILMQGWQMPLLLLHYPRWRARP